MTHSEKHSVEKQTLLAVVAETATVEEREQIGESWQVLSQLLKAHQPMLDDAQLIAQISQRMHRRQALARTRVLAAAALLVLFLGWLGIWIIGPMERNAPPVAAASMPLEHEAVTASKLLVPNKANTDTAASLNVVGIAARSDGLDWDDHLTEELAMAQQQVWSLQTNTTSSEAAYLQQRMSLLEDDLNNEAL